MTDYNNEQPQPERERPKHAADETGRSWLEAVQAARMNTERKREANAQLLEAWGVREDD
jgi:hypothetical protein